MERIEIREYKEVHPSHTRRQKSESARDKHPGKLPIILLKDKKCSFNLSSGQYLISGNMTVGGFIYALRRSITLSPSKGLYLFLNDILPVLNSRISELYERFVDEDGFLYFVYSDQEDKGSIP